MQRIFKYGFIQNIILTPDKELNILMFDERLPISLYKKLCTSKNGPVFWPTLYHCRGAEYCRVVTVLRDTALL